MKPIEDCNKPIKRRKIRERKNRRSIVVTGKNETQETTNSARETNQLMDPQSSLHISSDLSSGFPSHGANGVTLLPDHDVPANPVVPRINCCTHANGVGTEESELYSHHALIPAQPSDDLLSNGPMRLNYSLQNNMQYYSYCQGETHPCPPQRRVETQDFCFPHQSADQQSSLGAMSPDNNVHNNTQRYTYLQEVTHPYKQQRRVEHQEFCFIHQSADQQSSLGAMSPDNNVHNNTQRYTYLQEVTHPYQQQQRVETQHFCLEYQ